MRYCFLRFPGEKLKAVTLSYDDGCRADLRTAKILEDHGMRGTFNINSAAIHGGNSNRLSVQEIREGLLERGHEIAIHGENHLAPGIVLPTIGLADAFNCRTDLEKSFGKIIRGMAYPNSGIRSLHNWNDADAIKAYLRSIGIVYARTLGGDNNSFMLPTDWLEWMPTAKHTNPQLEEWARAFVSIQENSIALILHKYPRLFYLWGHSYEFDNDQNWDVLERFCDTIGGKEDTWYATNIEIYDYVRAYQSLIMSADGNIIYNPTDTDISLMIDNSTYTIPSGKTLTL